MTSVQTSHPSGPPRVTSRSSGLTVTYGSSRSDVAFRGGTSPTRRSGGSWTGWVGDHRSGRSGGCRRVWPPEQAELDQHPELIRNAPVLDYLAVGEARDVDDGDVE